MDVLIRPIVTEKYLAQAETFRRYAFVVDKRADKEQIRVAVQKFYGVTVEDVNTMIYGGKRKMRQTKSGIVHGKTNSYKKAVVTLAEGDSIDFYNT